MPIKPIRFTDEGLNRYGFRVLNSAYNIEGFKTNPVLYWNHGSDNVPLGKWNDIEEVDGAILGIPELDTEEELGARIARKIEKGYVNAASVGIRILEVNDDPMLMLEGQTRPTVTKCDLLEVSLVGIPANANAVRLYNSEGEVVNLSAKLDDTDLSKLELMLPTIKPKKESKMQLVIEKLGLTAGATEQQVIEAIKAKDTTIAELSAKVEAVELAAKADKAKSLVDAALSAKKITAAQKAQWNKLALADYDAAKETLDGMTAYESPTAIIQALQQGGNDAGNEQLSDAEKYDQLASNGGLVKLKSSNPVEFEKLQKAKVESCKL